MHIKKLIFAGILLTFNVNSSHAADDEKISDEPIIPIIPKKRAYLTSSDDSDNYIPDSINLDTLDVYYTEIKPPLPVNIHTITNPDTVYESHLSLSTLVGYTYILDVDGTVTMEPNPSILKAEDIVTPRGNVVENVRALLKKGAVVIFCSAWNKIEDTIKRLRQIGFTYEDLGVEEHATPLYATKIIKLPEGGIVEVKSMEYGRAISIKIVDDNSRDTFFRNKALSPFLHPDFDIKTSTNICFMEDSLHNANKFKEDAQGYRLFPNIEVNAYVIESFSLSNSTATLPHLPQQQEDNGEEEKDKK